MLGLRLSIHSFSSSGAPIETEIKLGFLGNTSLREIVRVELQVFVAMLIMDFSKCIQKLESLVIFVVLVGRMNKNSIGSPADVGN